jgi:glycosyltransferase involved in cell wall biosynthesis
MDSTINETPLISVLMPVFNCELYIEEAIKSILNQTYSNFEFLIIDDASKDLTISIIKSYDDSRIVLIEKPINTGLTNSLNLGLKLAKGKYIARMDGDDISMPERFAKQVIFLENNESYVLCGSNYTIIDSKQLVSLPVNHTEIKLQLLDYCVIAHPSVMIRNRILKENNLIYDYKKEPAEDYNFWVELIVLGKFFNFEEPLLKYRLHNTQVSQTRTIEQRDLGVDAKVTLLTKLDSSINKQEISKLQNLLSINRKIVLEDLFFFNTIKRRFKIANSNNFFDQKGFNIYLQQLEYVLVRSYFLKRTRYHPQDFLNYLQLRFTHNLKFENDDVLKLILKSFSFYKKN